MVLVLELVALSDSPVLASRHPQLPELRVACDAEGLRDEFRLLLVFVEGMEVVVLLGAGVQLQTDLHRVDEHLLEVLVLVLRSKILFPEFLETVDLLLE